MYNLYLLNNYIHRICDEKSSKQTDANKKAFSGLKLSTGLLSESWLEIFF